MNNGSCIFGHIESIFLDWLATFSSSIRIPHYYEEANKINDILFICEDFFQRRKVVRSIIWKILQPILSLCYESSKNVWNLDSAEQKFSKLLKWMLAIRKTGWMGSVEKFLTALLTWIYSDSVHNIYRTLLTVRIMFTLYIYNSSMQKNANTKPFV